MPGSGLALLVRLALLHGQGHKAAAGYCSLAVMVLALVILVCCHHTITLEISYLHSSKAQPRKHEKGGVGGSKLTMKRAPRAAGIEPTVCTASAHLTVVDDALGPRTVAFVAVLARARSQIARDVGEQRLNVTTAIEVEPLVDPTLCWRSTCSLLSELFAKDAVDLQLASIAGPGDLGGCPPRCRRCSLLRNVIVMLCYFL
jgi:hypothetical protein